MSDRSGPSGLAPALLALSASLAAVMMPGATSRAELSEIDSFQLAVESQREAEALAFIRAHEPTPRGYYAGPFGFFDARGEGAFVVALRSGLLSRAHATLHAGAGIVRGSSARSEWDETALKMGALLGALQGDTV